MITGYSIATLVLFFVSTFFVIYPFSFKIPIPWTKRRIPVRLDLNTVPIPIIAILWAAQCLGPEQIRNGIAGSGMLLPLTMSARPN